MPWSSGFYSWRTNRAVFYYDRDNPVFAEPRRQLEQLEAKLAELRAEMDRAAANDTAARVKLQEQIKRHSALLAEINRRLTAAARLATLAKARHEVTHQLCFNSGLLSRARGGDYPFWVLEGFSTNFEVCDDQGRGGPSLTNKYRMEIYRQVEQSGKLLKVRQLLSVAPGEDERATDVGDKYAQVWAMMHFLWNRHGANLRQFIEAIGEESSGGAEGFRRFFGDDLDALDQEYRDYMSKL